MAGLDPAIRSGTSLRQMANRLADRDEWVAINARRYNMWLVAPCLSPHHGATGRKLTLRRRQRGNVPRDS
jgi:hypothetical protein